MGGAALVDPGAPEGEACRPVAGAASHAAAISASAIPPAARRRRTAPVVRVVARSDPIAMQTRSGPRTFPVGEGPVDSTEPEEGRRCGNHGGFGAVYRGS